MFKIIFLYTNIFKKMGTWLGGTPGPGDTPDDARGPGVGGGARTSW